MKVINLASGSRGNSTYINCLNTHILVDVGLSFTEIKNRLAKTNVDVNAIAAIFITHEHFDHIRGLETFLKKCPKIKVFSSETVLNAIASLISIPFVNRNIIATPDFYFDDFTISAFSLSHDSRACLGYAFYEEGENKFTIATDVGVISKKLLEKIEEAKLVFLEANHNVEKLKSYNGYPSNLKARILSNRGHLCNSDCGKALAVAVSNFGYKKIALAHLSEKTNTPELALTEVLAEMKKASLFLSADFTLTCLCQDTISELFEI